MDTRAEIERTLKYIDDALAKLSPVQNQDRAKLLELRIATLTLLLAVQD
jgi:hypothetical protein